MLSERGLEPAVRALAARATVPVDIVGGPTGRLPAAVETAAYFVVSEALTNVSKYAHAGHATVRVERVDGRLLVEVSDDGIGGAAAGAARGCAGCPIASRRSAARSRSPARRAGAPGCAPSCPARERRAAARRRRGGLVPARAGVVRVLDRRGFAVVGEAGDAEELLEQVPSAGPTSP